MNALFEALAERLGMLASLPVVVGLATITICALLWSVFRSDFERTARRRMIDRHRADLRSRSLSSRTRHGEAQRARLLARAIKVLQLMPAERLEAARWRLSGAGLRSKNALLHFYIAKVVSSALGAILAFFFKLYSEDFAIGMDVLGLTLPGAALGFFVPNFLLMRRRKRRLLALQRGLPDALDLLVICAEAGLSLDAALGRVADEFGAAMPELAEELTLTAVELSFLPDRRQALLNLSRRVDLPAFRGVVTTLLQTEKYGTPLSQTLRTLSSEYREQRMLRAEEKAARLPATLTVPMIVFILPTLFIVLGGPAFIRIFDQLID